MGKKKSGSGSWLMLVKRVFNRRRQEHEETVQEEKKKEKRRWIFKRGLNNEQFLCDNDQQMHAMAVAAATTAAAEAAVATAQAAVEIARLTRPSNYVREHCAAIVIQTAFRGYLARRALRALRGIVKLQAIVRGENARNQAKYLTLKCMQALLRSHENQKARLSHEGRRRSMFGEFTGLWDYNNLHDIKNRNSTSRIGEKGVEYWEDIRRPKTSEGVEDMMNNCRADAQLLREKALAYAFSNQIWRKQQRSNSSMGDEEEIDERTKWLDRWMATKQWDKSTTRPSMEHNKRDQIKTLEIDDQSRVNSPYQKQYYTRTRTQYYNNSNSINDYMIHTPSPCRTKPIQVRSASPRCCIKEDKAYFNTAAYTPARLSNCVTNGGESRYGGSETSRLPNYMAATESAKARARSQSAPRQRPPTTPQRERNGSVKKRLSYPVPEIHDVGGGSRSQNLRTSSFKSSNGGYYGGMEQLSNYSSCYTESFGGEVSPSLSGSRFSLNLWE